MLCVSSLHVTATSTDGCSPCRFFNIFSILQMHEMLQMFGRDKDSETGSFTDSGRGPSEEGDTRPSPLDPKLNDDHKGIVHRIR